jgi:histidinol-phosphatase
VASPAGRGTCVSGCCQVTGKPALTTQAEAWVEAGVQIWDLAPLPIPIEEVGGRFTDLEGKPTHASGSCVASSGKVHEHVLGVLRGG